MARKKVNLVTKNGIGARVNLGLLIEPEGKYPEGTFLNANATKALLLNYLRMFHDDIPEEETEEDNNNNNNTPSQVNANGFAYVDLGLPSGTLWATMNIGAKSTREVGDEFEWGGIVPMSVEETEKFRYYDPIHYTTSKYNSEDHKEILDADDDTAHVLMGGDWIMPTSDAINELFTFCTIDLEHAFEISDETGTLVGIRLVSPINNNEIIFPYYGIPVEQEH